MTFGSPRFKLSKHDAKTLAKQAGVVGVAAAATFLLQGLMPGIDTSNVAGIGIATVMCIVLNVIQQWASDTRYPASPSPTFPDSPVTPPVGPPVIGPSDKPPVAW